MRTVSLGRRLEKEKEIFMIASLNKVNVSETGYGALRHHRLSIFEPFMIIGFMQFCEPIAGAIVTDVKIMEIKRVSPIAIGYEVQFAVSSVKRDLRFSINLTGP